MILDKFSMPHIFNYFISQNRSIFIGITFLAVFMTMINIPPVWAPGGGPSISTGGGSAGAPTTLPSIVQQRMRENQKVKIKKEEKENKENRTKKPTADGA